MLLYFTLFLTIAWFIVFRFTLFWSFLLVQIFYVFSHVVQKVLFFL